MTYHDRTPRKSQKSDPVGEDGMGRAAKVWHFRRAGRIRDFSNRTEGTVPGIDTATFEKTATEAKENCPVSKALKAVEITLTARSSSGTWRRDSPSRAELT